MDDGESRSGNRVVVLEQEANALIEFVCMAPHQSEANNAKGHVVSTHQKCWAYCARGAETNHDWIRVPATPLDRVTTGKMEERPPAPRLAPR